MLVLVLPPVSSCVSGFPVASPCLWGKLQNLSFCHVANCENWRTSRTKCWFFCIHVSCLESLVFLWRRRVYGGSWKTCPFRMFPGRLCCCFAWQTWHFLTFQPVWWCSQNFKIGGSLVRNDRFGAPTCLVSSLWFSCGFAVSMGEAAKPLLFEGFQGSCHVVLRGRRGTLWHSNLFDNVSKMSKLEDVSYEMLVFLHPRVLSRVSRFPVASPCLWGKLENMSSSNVSKQVVMSFCVAGVALCDIPTCLIMCWKCQNWRKSRTKCSFFCTHVSRLESLVFLCRRRVYGGSSALHTLHFTLHTPQFTL